jgi:hypothetical protein
LNKADNGKTFEFKIRIKDLSIHLERHDSLDVFPMMQVSLRPANLLVTTSDKDSRRLVTFVVKKKPKMGRLLVVVQDKNNEQVKNIRGLEKKSWSREARLQFLLNNSEKGGVEGRAGG